MAPLPPSRPVHFALLKRAASAAATGTFLVAVVFLLASLSGPSTAAYGSPGQEGQVSLLFGWDRPEPPAPKVNDLPLPADESEEAEASSPDLTTELNTWTPTQRPGSHFSEQHGHHGHAGDPDDHGNHGDHGDHGEHGEHGHHHHHHHHHSPHH